MFFPVFDFSCPERPHPTDTSRHVFSWIWSWRSPQWHNLPLLLHLNALKSWALPHDQIRPDADGSYKQHDRDWQYLRVCCPTSFQRCRVVQKHPWISGASDDWPSCPATASLVWALRFERFSVQYASSCGSPPCSSWTSCITHGCWQGRLLHGSHSGLPRTSREAQGTSCGFSGIHLHEGHRPLHYR